MNQKAAWRRFVGARRIELRDDYPCSVPTHRVICPKHRTPVGLVTQLCKACCDELLERLAGEYVAVQLRQEGEAA